MSVPVTAGDEQVEAALVDLVIRGMRRGRPDGPVQVLVETGQALVKGPVVMPAPGTEQRVRALLRLPEGAPERARVDALYEAFLPINLDLREVCTAWQCRPGGGPNDHSDARYDAQCRDDLDDVHERILPILRRLAGVVPRLERFPALLVEALDRLDGGEPAWFASPLCDSYHTVWMHLHQELIFALGLSRTQDEAREQLAVGRNR
jgi:hypothetical protein